MGGIGSGKSYVSRLVARLAPGTVVDADELAHQALDACARDGRLASTLGAEYVRDDGTADRAGLAARVFSEPAALRSLERLIHPAVLALIQDCVQDHRLGNGPPVLVLDVPLLIETGLDRRCDALWYVDAPEEMRLARAARQGLSPEEVRRRENNQSPLDRKRARADLIIRNDVEETELERQVLAGLQTLGVRPAAS